MTEKILATHCGQEAVEPGEFVRAPRLSVTGRRPDTPARLQQLLHDERVHPLAVEHALLVVDADAREA